MTHPDTNAVRVLPQPSLTRFPQARCFRIADFEIWLEIGKVLELFCNPLVIRHCFDAAFFSFHRCALHPGSNRVGGHRKRGAGRRIFKGGLHESFFF